MGGPYRGPTSRAPCPTHQPQPAALFGRQRFELGELIEDDKAAEVAGVVIGDIELGSLKEAVERLREKARHVLVRRYGLDHRDPPTLAELASELGVSRERVRQLQREAEHLLRTGTRRAAPRSAA